jgi:hypothetical protein
VSHLDDRSKRFDAMMIRAILDHCAKLSSEDYPLALPAISGSVFLQSGNLVPRPADLDQITDLSLAWSNDLASVSEADAKAIVTNLHDWSKTAPASRLTILMGRPLESGRAAAGAVSMAEMVERIDAAVDHQVQLNLVALYGRHFTSQNYSSSSSTSVR